MGMLKEVAVNNHWLTQAQLHELAENFRQTRQYIKKNPSQRFFKRKKRPWILLMGPPQAGKTTLLANSGLSLESPQKWSLQPINPSTTVDWWVAEQAVLIDIPGKYSCANKEEPDEQALWHSLLQLLKKYRKQTPLCG